VDTGRESRRRARATWPIRAYALGVEPPDDVSHLTPDERLALLWQVSRSAWLLAGNRMPDEPRSKWPGTVVRGA
jgi:hypothetical protein